MKLIILRGNSGSGKTTTAKVLQRKFWHGTMLKFYSMAQYAINKGGRI